MLLAFALAEVGAPYGAVAAAARPRLLRGVTASRRADATVVEIRLDAPFRYLAHAPSREGSTLRIRLRGEGLPLPPARGQVNSVIQWTQPQLVPLLDVELELDAADSPALVLHFSRRVRFEVQQRGDLERIEVVVSATGIERVRPEPVAPEPVAPEPAERVAPGEAGPAESRLDAIMDEGRKAMTAGDNRRAILLFQKVLGEPRNRHSAEAKELLGLAYQRKGQLAHAREEYEDYLRRYADSEGARRVSQRLHALLTARKPGRPRAQKTQPARRGFRHALSGSASQFYQSNIRDTDVDGSETTNAALDSDLFLTSRHSGDEVSVRTNFAGSYRYDFLGELDSSDATRITSGFVDVRRRRSALSARLGRQSESGSGVLGRFDGAKLGVPLWLGSRLELVSGFPVDFTESNRINHARPFYGVSLHLDALEQWDAELFAIQQRIEGVEDRRAVGGQVRFTGQSGFAFALVDYELSYRELNTLMFIANWRVLERTTLNALVDVRKSPVLTTFNALQGQPVDDFEDLEDLFSDDEIRELAEDRTADARTFTVGVSHELSSTWQLTGDATLSNLSETEASGGVDATPGTDNEYFYSLQATASGLLMEGSYTSFGLRVADGDLTDRYAVNLGGRYPLWSRLRVGPQLTVELRRAEDGEDTAMWRPSLKLFYRWRRLRFEAQGGVDLLNGTANDGESDETAWFFRFGYRYEL